MYYNTQQSAGSGGAGGGGAGKNGGSSCVEDNTGGGGGIGSLDENWFRRKWRKWNSYYSISFRLYNHSRFRID